jgi:hypothetical protein
LKVALKVKMKVLSKVEMTVDDWEEAAVASMVEKKAVVKVV